jgi:ATP-dependent Clp protease ATP-binding subunit ClpA
MALANRETIALGQSTIGPEHLLLGLLAEQQSVGVSVLKFLDVDAQSVRNKLSQIVSPGQDSGLGRRPHSQETREVIDYAISEARKLGHRYVGTEHLLLGLVRHRDSYAAHVLEQHGVGIDALREKVLATLRSDVDDTHDVEQLKHGEFEWIHQQELAKAFRSLAFWHTMILAVDSANRLGNGEVQPVHLLLALLRDPEGSVRRLLAEKGVTADWIREQIASPSS